MKTYIATGLERGDEAKALAMHLTSLGHEMTYAWWEHRSVQAGGPVRIAEVAGFEAAGVEEAELFIALLPGGRGTHTEIGMALAFSSIVAFDTKTIVLVGPTEDAAGRTCCFYLHPLVTERFDTVPGLLMWLKEMTWAE